MESGRNLLHSEEVIRKLGVADGRLCLLSDQVEDGAVSCNTGIYVSAVISRVWILLGVTIVLRDRFSSD